MRKVQPDLTCKSGAKKVQASLRDFKVQSPRKRLLRGCEKFLPGLAKHAFRGPLYKSDWICCVQGYGRGILWYSAFTDLASQIHILSSCRQWRYGSHRYTLTWISHEICRTHTRERERERERESRSIANSLFPE